MGAVMGEHFYITFNMYLIALEHIEMFMKDLEKTLEREEGKALYKASEESESYELEMRKKVKQCTYDNENVTLTVADMNMTCASDLTCIKTLIDTLLNIWSLLNRLSDHFKNYANC